ncbi:MAG: PAS domain S-box protein [Verrucomicrobiota bacterium]|nr:PAS domain S-box protein [Verrucomicrobiota bacterium]
MSTGEGFETSPAEQRLRAIVNATTAIVWRTDPAGVPLGSVPTPAEFTGMPAELFARAGGWTEAFHPDDRERVIAAWNGALAAGEPFSVCYRLRHHDGTWRDIYSRAVAIRERDGSIQEWVGVDVDVTSQKRATEALRFHSHVLAQIGDAVIACDVAGHVIYMNGAAEKLHQWTGAEAVGRHVKEVAGAQMSKQEIAAIIDQVDKFGKWSGEFVSCRRDGAELVLELTTTGLRDEEGKLTAIIGISRDITTRKAADEALRNSEQRFRQLAENVEEVFWMYDVAEEEYLYLSPAYERIWGWPVDVLIGRGCSFSDQVVEEDGPIFQEHLRQERLGQCEATYRIRRPDGSIRWIFDRSFPVRDELGRIYRLAGIGRDITERMEAERALREGEERFRAAFEQAPVGICEMAFDGTFTRVNARLCQLWRYPSEELMAKKFSEITHPEDLAKSLKLVGELSRGERESFAIDKRYIRKGGESMWAHSTVSLLRTNAGEPQKLIAIVEDVNERRKMEETLRQSERELRNLASRLITIREAETARIAREIHDQMGQALTALKMDVAALEHGLSAEPECIAESETAARIQTMSATIESILATALQLCTELRPPVLDELGLVPAIEWAARDFEARNGIFCNLHLPSELLEIEHSRATAMFRIFQEILTNVVRHAEATEITVTLAALPDLRLEVTDNGRGLGPDKSSAELGLGVIGMRERAFAVGGRIELREAVGGGTTVIVEIPNG